MIQFDLDKLENFRRHLLATLRIVESQIAVEKGRQEQRVEAKIFLKIGVSA